MIRIARSCEIIESQLRVWGHFDAVDLIAAMVCAGVRAAPVTSAEPSELARHAYEIADALLVERDGRRRRGWGPS